MRDTFESIDEATRENEDLRAALYDLAAQQLAAQALPILMKRHAFAGRTDAARLIEEVAGYPGVTSRQFRPRSQARVGSRATEILVSLAKDAQIFRE